MDFNNFKENKAENTFNVNVNGTAMLLGTKTGELKSGGPIIDLSNEMKELLNDDVRLALDLFSAASAHFGQKGVKLNIA